MKIAYIGPAYPWRGGISEFLMNSALKSFQSGHSVKVFSFSKQYPKLIFPGKDQIDYSKKEFPFPVEQGMIPYNPLTWNKAVKSVLDFKPDLIIFKYWIPFFAPMYAYMIRKMRKNTKAKMMYILHNIEFHEKWPMAEFLTALALKHADFLVTLSSSVYNSVFKILPDFPAQKVIQAFHPNYEIKPLSPEETDLAFSQLDIPKKKTALFFGYIKHYKGLDILINAFRKVVDHNPDIQLLIAGEVYGNDQVYHNLIKENNLSDHIIFHNHFIHNDDIPKYFAVADVVVQPYRSATQSGISLLAFSYHKPVISTQTGALDEIVKANQNGILVPVENPDALAQAIIDYFEKYDTEFMIQFIKNEIEAFSWDSFQYKILAPVSI
jgi:glycosyltransferase involved in cell wall biosynthesis